MLLRSKIFRNSITKSIIMSTTTTTTLQRKHKEGKMPADIVQVFGSNNNSADHPPVKLPDLTPESASMKNYWPTRWELNATNGKISERKGDDALFITNLNRLLHFDQQGEEDKKLKFDRFFDPQFAGLHAIVTLCGDSGLLAFLFQSGFNVTGVDLSEIPLRKIMQEASAGLPEGFGVIWNENISTETGHKIFTGKVVNNIKQEDEKEKETEQHTVINLPQITLICGDFFTAPLDIATNNQGFDIFYDRASACAIPIALRDDYFKKIRSTCLRRKIRETNQHSQTIFKNLPENVGTCIYFALYQRTAEGKLKNAGTPFYFPPEEVNGKYYNKENGFDFEVVHFPTEEECEVPPGKFLEGTSHAYQKI